MRGLETIFVFFIVLAFIGVYNLFLPIMWINAVHNVVVVVHPFSSFIVILFLLALTLDSTYMPTGVIFIAYVYSLLRVYPFYQGGTPLEEGLKIVGSMIGYLTLGFIWLRVKWRLYLDDPCHSYSIKNVNEGQESDYLVRVAGDLYHHFLYWPFSIVHLLCSDLFFKAFKSLLFLSSGYFTRLLKEKRTELKSK